MFNWFQNKLLTWYTTHGRHDLPWQNHSPYYTWLSEIMLQQTQVSTVIPYFQRFTTHFPDIFALANGTTDEVFKLWAGLGYYHRAKNLHSCAKIIVAVYNGQFPNTLDKLMSLPGIGPSTAAAIASLAFNLPHAIFDGNVKRVLARFFGVEGPINDKYILKNLAFLAHECMPKVRCAEYTQAIMDMGATCCKPRNPQCDLCPLMTNCQAFQEQKTTTIPGKAHKNKIKQVRHDFAVFFNDQGALHLKQRPDEGIWPNLWCFPEMAEKPNSQLNIKHQLTHQSMSLHFHILKHPENKGPWFSRQQLEALALPSAIGKAIKAIFLAVESRLHESHPADH